MMALAFMGLVIGTVATAHEVGRTGSDSAAIAGPILTDHEAAWLAAHPVIRFAPDPSWPPIDFVTPDGQHRGIAADYLRLIEEKLGVVFSQVYSPTWDQSLTKLTTKEVDLVTSCVVTPERQAKMLFTSAYLDLINVIITPSKAGEHVTLKDLKGRTVATVAGHAVGNYVADQVPTARFKTVPDFRTGLRDVSFGDADAMVGNIASASYLIEKDGITNLRIGGKVGFDYHICVASRNDWPELNQILEKALATITPAEKQAIYSKWVHLEEPWFLISPAFWLWSAAAMLLTGLVLAGVVLWNRSLKQQVRLRTEQLSNELAERQRAEQERRRLEDNLRQAQKMEMLGTLAAGVAHDFNNILTIVSGFTAVARAQLAPDHAAQESLGTVETAVNEASGITRSLLTLSHKAPPIKTAIDLRHVVGDSLRLVRRVLPAMIEIEDHVRDGEPVFVNADVGQLHQIILNLATNARDAMLSGGRIRVCLSVSAIPADSNQTRPGHAVLEFSDTGEGVSPEVLNHVFEPFFTTKPRGEGTGLGLPMVRAIITEHEGSVAIDSRVDQGTRVTIQLPLCHPPCPEPLQADELQQAARRPCSVLLAEDSPQVRAVILRALERGGFSVVESGSGDEAAVLLAQRLSCFDVAVLDFDLPHMDGLEIARRIHAIDPTFPIVIVSGNPNLQISENPNLHRLCKPFAMSELVELIPQLASRRASKPGSTGVN